MERVDERGGAGPGTEGHRRWDGSRKVRRDYCECNKITFNS